MAHRVYREIVRAIESGRLIEPFSIADFRRDCLGLGEGTYNAFLYKHRKGNPGNNSELFEKVAPSKFICLRPFRYGL